MPAMGYRAQAAGIGFVLIPLQRIFVHVLPCAPVFGFAAEDAAAVGFLPDGMAGLIGDGAFALFDDA